MNRLLTIASMLLVTASSTRLTAGDGAVRRARRPIPNTYIVSIIKPSDVAPMAARAQALGARTLRSWNYATYGFAIEASDQVAAALSHDPRVAIVEEDEVVPLALACPITQKYPSNSCADGKISWQLDRMDNWNLPADGKYTYCYTGSGVRIYVADSGVRGTHDDFRLSDGSSRVIAGPNYIQDGHTATEDPVSHGTIVAAMAAGRKSGPAKDASIVSVRVSDGNAGTSTWITALNWIKADHDAHPGPAVVTYAFGAASGSSFQSAFRALLDSGVLVVASAGNSGGNDCGLAPQNLADTITVGGTDANDNVYSSSNFGSCVTVMAPAVTVGAGYSNNDFAYNCNPGWTGTSFAAGLGAGMAAVYLERYFPRTPANIKQMLIANALPDSVHGLRTGTPNRLLQGTCYPPGVAPSSCPPTVRRRAVGHQTIQPGSAASLSADIDPAGSTLQWFSGTSAPETAVSGATSATTTVAPSYETNYWLRITNPYGESIDSDPSTVSVCQAPAISVQPQNASAVQRYSWTGMSVGATGSGLTYQWYAGDTSDTRNLVSGATAWLLAFPATYTEKYWVRVTGNCGYVDSNAAWLSVYAQITQQPSSVTLTEGSTARFAVDVDGTYLHYTWRADNGAAIAGAPDAPVYTSGALYTNKTIWCDVTSGPYYATVQSYPATATLCDGVYVTSMPVTSYGGSCRHIALNTTGPADSYAWYQGARGDTSVSVPSGSNELDVCPSSATTYWCRITRGSCYTDSPAVTLP